MRRRVLALATLTALVVLLAGCPQNMPPDFRLEASVSSVQVHQGGSATAGLRIDPLYGFKGTVELSLKLRNGDDLPPGLSFSPATVSVTGSAVDVILTISADSSVPTGSYAAELTAVSGSIKHSIGFGIEVVPPAGSLDAGFGQGGVVTLQDLTQEQGEDDLAYSLALGSGGSLYLLGRSGEHLVVTKLSDSGEQAAGFATGGVLNLATVRSLSDDGGESFDLDHAIVPLFGGGFLAAGYAYDATNNDDLILAKFDENGVLDSNFGSGGIQSYDNLLYSGSGHANDMAFSLATGSAGVWVAGMAYANSTDKEQALAMKVDLSSPGTPKVAGYGGSGSEYAYSILPVGDGAFIFGASNDGGLTGAWGHLDADLQDVGHGMLDAFSGGQVRSACRAAGGGYVLAGYSYDSSTSNVNLVLAKLKDDGSLDNTFGQDGVASFDGLGGLNGWGDFAYSVSCAGNGDILVTGRTVADHNGRKDYDLLVMRLNADGTLDESFGEAGVFLYDGGHGNDGGFEVALDGSGRPVAVGYTTNADGDLDLLALRLVP